MASCGLVNLGSCLAEKLFEYLANIINSPIQPILQFNLNLLSEPINLSLFSSLWAIILYLISMFYALLLIYSGFNFIISGYDSAKRENAKTWLRNIIIMIILVQSSFFIYQLAIDLSASMTSAMLTLVNSNFYLLGSGGISDAGMALVVGTSYIGTLLITAFILIIRYVIVAVGVVLFPLAIFFYFIPPLKPYGLLIINFLGVCIFITFLDAIILIGFSQVAGLSVFNGMSSLVLASAFGLINILMFFLMFFSIIKSAYNTGTKIAAVVATVTA